MRVFPGFAIVLAGLTVAGCITVIPDSEVIAQGGTANVELRSSVLYMDTSRPASSPALSPAEIKRDIRACKDQGEGSVSKAELKTYEWTGGISQQAVDRWAQGYIDCMTAKGYRVTRWEPKGYR